MKVAYNFTAKNITQKVVWNSKHTWSSTLFTLAFFVREALYPTFIIDILNNIYGSRHIYSN